MEQIFEKFTFAVLKLNKLVQKIKSAEMEPYGLKAIHAMCIFYLRQKPLTAGELARLTLEDKGAISRALKQLKEQGYIRYNGAYHERVALTEAGETLARTVSERAERAVAAAKTPLSERERDAFFKTLDSVAENLAEYCRLLEGEQS